MAESFKEQINRTVVENMAQALTAASPGFRHETFLAIVMPGLENLELKARCLRLVEAMTESMPGPFAEIANAIRAALPAPSTPPGTATLKGWCLWAVQEYIARIGIQEPEIALPLLRDMTPHFSSEFGIRPFLEEHPALVLKTFQLWARNPDEHIRRLASEGSRTRLPWGKRLKRLTSDPSPMLPILELLKDDPSEYVRRSVANHLNDWSRDHPELTCTIAERWWVDASPQRRRLISHALRTLVKAGNPRALAILGCSPPELEVTSFVLQPTNVNLGESLTVTASLASLVDRSQSLIIDYVIHHRKANGNLSPKVFKGSKVALPGGGRYHWKKQHALRPVTTRTYYPGLHRVELVINGKSFGIREFRLEPSV
jgi:3-methyladenine DNA glycosylase AlkC